MVAHNHFGLEVSFIKLSKHCRPFDKGFSLHRSIMPTTGYSKEVNEEEKILGPEREKRGRKTAVTKTPHTLERLDTSGKDSGSIENEIKTLWRALDACITVMEELQGAYFTLGRALLQLYKKEKKNTEIVLQKQQFPSVLYFDLTILLFK